MGLVMGRNGPTHIILGRTIIDTFYIRDTIVAVVKSITPSKKVAVDIATRSLYISAALHLLIFLRRWIVRCIRVDACTTHITADIAAAINCTHMTIHDFRPCAVVYITLLATTI